jgi:hypothetical protein
LSNGASEGRETDDFDEVQYLANYPDLQAAFGSNTDAATQHYIEHGFDEGRVDFDGFQYIASHGDLIAAFGMNEAAGVQHYLDFGEGEGRELDTFDEEHTSRTTPTSRPRSGPTPRPRPCTTSSSALTRAGSTRRWSDRLTRPQQDRGPGGP